MRRLFCNFISDFITIQITSCFCCSWIVLLEAVLSASVTNCLAWTRGLSYIYCLSFDLHFYHCFCPYFKQKTKIRNFWQSFISWLNSTVSHGKPYSITRKLWIKSFKNIKCLGEISNNWVNDLEQMYTRL